MASLTDCVPVLIVIPTLNEAHNLARVVTEVTEALPDGLNCRIVIADGGSNDGTREIATALAHGRDDFVLMDNPARIQSAGINRAVAHYGEGYDVLVRCDAHAEYPAGFVAALVKTLHRTGADSVVVPMDSAGKSGFQRACAWVSDTKVGSGGSAHRGGRFSGWIDHGHHAAIRLAAFRAINGYDPTFLHNEDAEFDARLAKAGYRVWLDANIRLAYHPRANIAALWRQYRNYGRGRARTVSRHPGSLRLRQMIVPANLLMLVASLGATGFTPLGWIWPCTYSAILTTTSLALTVRHRDAAALMAGIAAGVMHAAWGFGFLESLLFGERISGRFAVNGPRPTEFCA